MIKVIAICIAPTAGEPMQRLHECIALAGLGIEGDRYALQQGSWMAKGETAHKPKRNVTLMTHHAILAANRTLGVLERYQFPDTRRNILLDGIENINELVGREFVLGRARLRGIEPADPCDRPDWLLKRVSRTFATAFEGRGGLNAEVLQGGRIHLDDILSVQTSTVF